jgi:leucyl aminopeptidase
MCPNPNLPVPDDFTPVPSTSATTEVSSVEAIDASAVDVLAVVVPADGDLPSELGDLDRDTLGAAGFDGKPGSTFCLPRAGAPAFLLVGAPAADDLDANALRDAAATASRTSAKLGARLTEMGCGGLLGVNRGSVEPPRMIVMRYQPEGEPTGHLALVGKGIMYDSGGINLKPSDESHSQMKNDMTGAAAILAAMTALREVGCRARVTAYLMCTDNMPSGSAMQLGDVLTARNGKTVEVKNTDAEGRLVMMDGLSLAVEDEADVIVDIATLTGAVLVALGPATAGLFGNEPGIIEQVKAAGAAVDEPVWQLPLEKKYRKTLDSEVADIANLGGPYAGSTTAALFLAEFVGEVPWAHIDIAGTMNVDADESWRSKGATGYGARLLAELARDFTPKA